MTYRIYHFSNMYLSSIQQGIQSAHAQTEMFLKYSSDELINNLNNIDENIAEMFWEWASEHKTIICLNGGMDINLREIKQLMSQPENPYPWSYFNEAKEAMNGMLTNVAIVLPSRIYDTAADIRFRKYHFEDNTLVCTETGWGSEKFTYFEIQLIELLNSCSLAK